MTVPFNTDVAEARLRHVGDLAEGAIDYVEELLQKAVDFCNTVTWELEVITPKVANDILDNQGGVQRTLRTSVVKKYLAFQELGRWDPFNGDSIKFNVEGKLLDGQHRLETVVESGVPMLFLVIRGLPIEAEMTLDQGTRRTPSDLAKLAGIDKYSGTVMTAARIVDNYLVGKALDEHMTVSSDMLLDSIVEEWPSLVDSAAFIHQSGAGKYPRASVSTAVHFLIGLFDTDKRDEFFAEFLNQTGKPEDSAAWMLREKLTVLRGAKRLGRKFNEVLFTYWVSAWESWKVSHKRQKFPSQSKLGGYMRFQHLIHVEEGRTRRW